MIGCVVKINGMFIWKYEFYFIKGIVWFGFLFECIVKCIMVNICLIKFIDRVEVVDIGGLGFVILFD